MRFVVGGLLLCACLSVRAAPGDVLFEDDFERGALSAAWTASDGRYVGVSRDTANSGRASAYLSQRTSSLTMRRALDLDLPAATLEYWIRRGSDSFSEDPDDGEDLVVEYYSDGNIWRELTRYVGEGTPGEIYEQSHVLPDDALHGNFQLRLRLLSGSGQGWDYWHIDDVVITESTSILSEAGQCYDFSDQTPFTRVSGNGFVRVDSLTYASPPYAMSIYGRGITVQSETYDSSADFWGVSIWVRRGSDSFSENPDSGEDLSLEYLDASGQWRTLERFAGNGTQGEIFARRYDLSNVTRAHHSGFRLRLRLHRGSGEPYDFWHIDDVCFISTRRVAPVRIQIGHDAAGQYCLPETVTLRATYLDGSPADDFVGSVVLNTSSTRGDWSVTQGNGPFDNAAADDGTATYDFVAADQGQAILRLAYQGGNPAVNIGAVVASDGTTDDDSEGLLLYSPTGFAVTSSLLPDPVPAGFAEQTFTVTAGNSFPLHLTALGGGICGALPDFDGSQTLMFWQEYVDPTTGTLVSTVEGAALGTARGSAAAMSVSFSSGRAVVDAMYADAGGVRLRVADAGGNEGSGYVLSRPADLIVTDVRDLANQPNPGGSALADSGFVAAGRPFAVTVEARNTLGGVTPNFGNETSPESVSIRLDQIVTPIGGGGSLNNGTGFLRTAPGRFRNASVSFSEVGSLTMRVDIADGNYLGTGPVTGTPSTTVGRFYPFEFRLQSSAITPACGSFTYMDQPELGVRYSIAALGATGATLTNYDAIAWADALAVVSVDAENADAGTNLGARLSLPGSVWRQGVYAVDTGVGQFDRTGVPDGPYELLDLGVVVTDSVDGIELASRDMDAGSSGACATCTARTLGQTALRYGRLLAFDQQGPEDRDMDLNLEAQYWNGAFVLNTNDSCSLIAETLTSLHTYQGDLNAGETQVVSPLVLTSLVNGQTVSSPIVLSAPGESNRGSVMITYDVPPWLEFDWQGTGDADPEATALFGFYRGHDRVISWGEILR